MRWSWSKGVVFFLTLLLLFGQTVAFGQTATDPFLGAWRLSAVNLITGATIAPFPVLITGGSEAQGIPFNSGYDCLNVPPDWLVFCGYSGYSDHLSVGGLDPNGFFQYGDLTISGDTITGTAGDLTSSGMYEIKFSVTLKRVPNFNKLINNNSILIDPNYAASMIGAEISIGSGPSSISWTIREAALSGGYDHFNWLNQITSFGFNGQVYNFIEPCFTQANGDCGIVSLVLGLCGRQIGIDPLLGGNECNLADYEDPYWDEWPVIFRDKYFFRYVDDADLTGHKVNETTFRDGPNLIGKGWQAFFKTSFIGVKPFPFIVDNTVGKLKHYDILSDKYPNSDKLTFFWSYTQTSNCVDIPYFPCHAGNIGIYQNIDPARGGGGEVRFLGTEYQIPVSIDVKPGSSENSINLRSHGSIPVVILSSPSFDAVTQVDPTSLSFGRSGDELSLSTMPHPEDVNGDGLLDLVCHFDNQKAGFIAGDKLGMLKGKLKSGARFLGIDIINIVP